jgi:DNA-3-methyladenine glycosylase II
MEIAQFSLATVAPFAFGRALDYLRGSPARIVERVDDLSYHRPLRLEGVPAVLSVEGVSTEPTELRVTVRGESLPPRAETAARRIVERVFSPLLDLAELEAVAADTDGFGRELARLHRGVRVTLLPDLFETLTWAIIGQQINVIFAAKCKRAFVERFGETFEIAGQSWRLFPTPERVVTILESELAEIQFSRQKIRYVLNLAREIVEGQLVLSDLFLMEPDAALQRLERLTGIGRWTAEYVLMRGIGHRDVIPAADGGLRRIIGQRYGLGRLASEAEVREIAARWTGWRSYFAFYLWFTLQEEEAARRALRANRTVKR